MSEGQPAELRMATQIARNLAVLGEKAAVQRTAEHIKAYWDPRMIARLRDLAPVSGSDLIAAIVAEIPSGRSHET
ncbi:formate dehydrogenase subunit delta [Novosphingobium colocasiae]|uniref:Formate dehydrogenase n=1 Tax=Novosphingobium colocasiae TaxID=1256513 RepID=A0A918UI47_9SPHN|nr:formate dehydrogenase subunit delta [Novosphingobium colocasiae]GGZ11501.1 hypothetical protein GCM10011614_28150 [Novosphingobium colocasiae]